MKINEIFDSLSGECDGFGGQGKPATFIRFQGCNLDPGCTYCDTPLAKGFHGWQCMSVDDVMESVTMPKVIITGGEPLLQYDEVVELTKKLLEANIRTTIETNGSIQVPRDFLEPYYNLVRTEYLRIVMDYKLPSSGMEQYMDPEAHYLLGPVDVIKFVIADAEDYTKMKEVLADNLCGEWQAQIAISPMLNPSTNLIEGCGNARRLAEQMIYDPDLRDAQFNIQLHKLLGIK